jgi:hypothetical protein
MYLKLLVAGQVKTRFYLILDSGTRGGGGNTSAHLAPPYQVTLKL